MSIRVSSEVPSGAIDGANQTYTLSSTAVPGSVEVFYRGQRIDKNSVSVAADNKTLVLNFAPEAAHPADGNGLVLEVEYDKVSTLWVERS